MSSTRLLPILLSVLAKYMSSGQNHREWRAGAVWLYLHDHFQYYNQRLRKVCSPDRTLATFQASTIGPYSHDLLECYDERLRKFCSSDTRLLTFDARAVQQHPHDYFQYYYQCLRKVYPLDRTIATGQASAVWVYLTSMSSGRNHLGCTGQTSMAALIRSLPML